MSLLNGEWDSEMARVLRSLMLLTEGWPEPTNWEWVASQIEPLVRATCVGKASVEGTLVFPGVTFKVVGSSEIDSETISDWCFVGEQTGRVTIEWKLWTGHTVELGFIQCHGDPWGDDLEHSSSKGWRLSYHQYTNLVEAKEDGKEYCFTKKNGRRGSGCRNIYTDVREAVKSGMRGSKEYCFTKWTSEGKERYERTC